MAIPGAVGAGPARAGVLRYLKTVERMPGGGEPACEPAPGAWLRAFIASVAGRCGLPVADGTLPRPRLSVDGHELFVHEYLLSLDEKEFSLDEFPLPLDEKELSVHEFLLSLDGKELSVDEFPLSLDEKELSVHEFLLSVDGKEFPLDEFSLRLDENELSVDEIALPFEGQPAPRRESQPRPDSTRRCMACTGDSRPVLMGDSRRFTVRLRHTFQAAILPLGASIS
jgi:hypothetical protein